jgi:deferrochelatase/peroxidase EfeB
MVPGYSDEHIRVDDVQGDVIPGFRKLNHVFFMIHSKDHYNLWAWLRSARNELTSALHVLTAEDCGSSSETFRTIAVTYDGLSKLNADLAAEAAEFRAFSMGAASRAARLREKGTSDPKAWLFGGKQSPNVHVALRLASNSDINIVRVARSVQLDLRRHGLQTLWTQWGRRLGSESAPREHFGFREDLSQPQVRGLPQPFRDSRAGRAATSPSARRHTPCRQPRLARCPTCRPFYVRLRSSHGAADSLAWLIGGTTSKLTHPGRATAKVVRKWPS